MRVVYRVEVRGFVKNTYLSVLKAVENIEHKVYYNPESSVLKTVFSAGSLSELERIPDSFLDEVGFCRGRVYVIIHSFSREETSTLRKTLARAGRCLGSSVTRCIIELGGKWFGAVFREGRIITYLLPEGVMGSLPESFESLSWTECRGLRNRLRWVSEFVNLLGVR